MIKRLILTTTVLFFSLFVFAQSIPAPSGLTVELLRAPEAAVITNPQPHFGWIFPKEGVTQQAYQILVATSSDRLEPGKTDLWDSGRTESDQSVQVAYRGKTLHPNSAYWWAVRVWSQGDGVSSFSKPQLFLTGRFSRPESDWPGQSDWVKTPSGDWVAEDRQMARFEDLSPKSFEKTGATSWFADFGKAAFATLEVTVKAKKSGATLALFLGERRQSDRTVHKDPGVSNIGFFQYTLALKKGTHTYEVEIPRHDARYPHSQKLAPFYPEVLPFRFVEANGTDGVRVKGLTQKALFYYFDDEASRFSSSDEKLNQVWDLCKYTLKATPFLGVYCDGNRERMPYEADAYIQQLGHYSVDREYSAARYTTAFLLSHASWPTEWQMHTVMMAHQHLMHTGDTSFLGMIYEPLKEKTLIKLQEKNGLISTTTGKVTPEFLKSINLNRELRDITDWPAGTPEGKTQAANAGPTPEGERDGFVFTDYNTVVNAFHYHALECMATIAGALGKKSDQKLFSQVAKNVKDAVLEHMFDPKRGIFVDGIGTDHASLHANMFPLAFRMVPREHVPAVVEFVKSRGMACSVYGAQYLLEALYTAGEAGYALALMTSESKRSWMNMLNVGSTMTTEAWDEYYKPNLTWNHAWGAAPGNIIPRWMMGIQPLVPGFGTFSIAPQPASLEQIDLELPTIRGTIIAKLQATEKSWQMSVEVPGNSQAVLLLPAVLSDVTVNGEKRSSQGEAEVLDGKRNVFILKSGSYQITARGE